MNQNGKNWECTNSDCIPFVQQSPNESIHLSIYSPPFANLYTYSELKAKLAKSKAKAEKPDKADDADPEEKKPGSRRSDQ